MTTYDETPKLPTPFPFSCFPFTEVNGHHMSLYLLFTSWNQYPYSPYCSHRILKGTDKENLFKSQELLLLLIFLLILVTSMCDSGEKLDASQSLEGKGLILINPSEWRGELREKFFFVCFCFFFFSQQITMLQSSTLSYECDQSQSTSHILVCLGFRTRFSGLLTRLTLWS